MNPEGATLLSAPNSAVQQPPPLNPKAPPLNPKAAIRS